MRTLTLSAAALVLSATLASAADLPRRAMPLPPIVSVPVFTWTGFYAGVNAGYDFGTDDRAVTVGTPDFLTLVPGGFVPDRLDASRDGFVGGAQVGFNYQAGAFVLGVEADIQFVDGKIRSAFVGAPVLGTQLETFAEAKLDYLGTVRGRVGVALDRLLVYATGGLAYGGVSLDAGVTGVQAPALGWRGSASEVQTGWTVGAGVEYAVTGNLTLKGEYLYYDLGSQTVRTVPNAAALATVPGVAYDTRIETTGQIGRVGLNYKF